MYHNPVLLQESVDGLNIRPGGTYVDVTYGGGGHTAEILRRLSGGRVFAFDQDEDALAQQQDDSRLTFIRQNFRYMENFLESSDAVPVHGILADLGVSSHQFDEASRGFSIRFDAPLDMRMDRNGSLTAAVVLNTYEEEALADVFYRFGELHNSRRIASVVAEARNKAKIKTTGDLISLLKPMVPAVNQNQFLARVFQALRMEVNHELDALKEFLLQSSRVLAPGGRLCVIAYHSLEDRLVKNFMHQGKFEGAADKDFFGHVSLPFRTINRKVITPGEAELKTNNRSRSARLRIAEKN